MSDSLKISCSIGATDLTAGLGFELWVDDQCLYNTNNVDAESIPVEVSVPDVEGEHELRFVLKNKVADHTKIDADGNIVTDASLILSDVAFDDIKLGYLMTKLSTYTHNFNGTGEPTQDQFFSEMGCNGVVSLKFTSPFYLWLLEHM
jgi:hypothetical protein